MKTDYHSLLRRQLRRLSLDGETLPTDMERWRALLSRVDSSYTQADEDRYLIERSLELSSQELRQMYEELERRSNTELARRHAHNEAVMRALEDGLCTLSLDGACQSANKAAIEQLQISAHELDQIDILDRFDLDPEAEDRVTIETIRADLIEGKTLRFDHARLIARDENRPVSCSLTPLRLGEETVEFVFLFRDMSSMEELHEELRRARDAALEASVAMSRFLANMSHELRTPLNTIIGYVGLVEEEVEELGETLLVDDLGKINVAAKHLLQLINNILDLSKIEAGEVDIHIAELELGAFCQELDATLDPLVKAHGNRLIIEYKTPRRRVQTDALKLRQMLINLVSNAAKFTRDGTITLRVEEVGEMIHYDIIDTGVGIPEDQLLGLFAEFKQLDNAITRASGGTGLGLNISMNLARILGGTIVPSSTVGEGTTFSIRLPLTPPSDSPDEPTPE